MWESSEGRHQDTRDYREEVKGLIKITIIIISVGLVRPLSVSHLKRNHQNRRERGRTGVEAVRSDVTHRIKPRRRPLT